MAAGGGVFVGGGRRLTLTAAVSQREREIAGRRVAPLRLLIDLWGLVTQRAESRDCVGGP
jgi:hypothetical protein